MSREQNARNIIPFDRMEPNITASIIDLISKPKFVEIESQYDLVKTNGLKRLQKICKSLNDPNIKLISGAQTSRPISVYFDVAQKLLLCNSGYTMRFRYGGGGYSAQVGVKINIDKLKIPEIYKEFERNARQISHRIEIEHTVDPQKFQPSTASLLPIDEIPIAGAYLRGRIDQILDGNPISPIFVTSSNRLRYVLDVSIPKNKKVGLELSLDSCYYYTVSENARIYVPPHAKAEEKKLAIISNPDRTATAKINGNEIGYHPQFELEFLPEHSSENVSREDITRAEEMVCRLFSKELGEGAFASKESKSAVGYALLKKLGMG
ncbi:MAG: hypothetical protein PHX43_05455 [Alphaproteobacteria bacterium]|nr:hypothetical protein [Alphaproteobacteria bacterium]